MRMILVLVLSWYGLAVAAQQPRVQIILAYSTQEGGTVSGRAPDGVDIVDVIDVLGLSSLSGDLQTSDLPGAEWVLAHLSIIGENIVEFESLSARISDDLTTITGMVRAGQGCAIPLLKDRLSADLGTSSRIDLTRSLREPKIGSKRINASTGKAEIYQNCYWIEDISEPQTTAEIEPQDPTPPTSPLAACQGQLANMMGRERIEFLSGKTDLNATSLGLIDRLTPIVANCVKQDLTLLIAGHTDDRGAAELNQRISQQRADAVQTAFTERGLETGSLSAKGFGETTPIASNDTANGRAQNRRITLEWVENEQ